MEVADPGTYHESETGSTEVDVDDRAGGGRGQVAGGQSQRQEAACHQVIYGRGRSCTEVGLHAVTVSETRSKEDRKFVGKKFIVHFLVNLFLTSARTRSTYVYNFNANLQSCFIFITVFMASATTFQQMISCLRVSSWSW